jgi:hypothetical protein
VPVEHPFFTTASSTVSDDGRFNVRKPILDAEIFPLIAAHLVKRQSVDPLESDRASMGNEAAREFHGRAEIRGDVTAVAFWILCLDPKHRDKRRPWSPGSGMYALISDINGGPIAALRRRR